MSRLWWTVLLCLPVALLGLQVDLPGHQVPQAPDDPAAQLFTSYWTWRLDRSPEFATLVGDRSHNAQLENFTETRFGEDLAQVQMFLKEATELMNQAGEGEEKLNLEFFISELETFRDGYNFSGFYFPISYLEGVQVDFQRLAEWSSPSTQQDYQDILTRYELLPQYMDQVIVMLDTAVVKGLTNSMASMSAVLDQCSIHTSVPPTETVFYQPFLNLTQFSSEVATELQEAAVELITNSIQPAFSDLASYLEETYIPAARPDIAVSTLPDIGPAFYKACLKFHTSTDLTADQIHNKGLEEVQRIEKEMVEIVEEMGYNLTLPQFTEMIRTDPANYFDSPEELLQAFHDIIENRIESGLLSLFNNKPQTPLEIVGMPPSMADAPMAFYTGGSTDGSRPGRLYVNINKFGSQPRYEMVSLSLHETNPGHHLQASYSLAQQDWPMFRKVMEDRIYSQTPSRFPINTAYIEGWALYSEKLGYDLELYEDPLDRFGHLSEEIFRACRLVVDTGMHAKNWTEEAAVQFMMSHTAASEESLRNEITRYITWPGQATGYKIGQLKILELREKAASSLGDKFNIKDFHDVVLRCAGPLNILEQEVDSYIQAHS